MSELPSFSVIVPAYNAAAILPRGLQALAAQDHPRERYEVIVVDDGSTDGTADIAAASGARVVRLSPNRGKVAAREAGVRAARHETLVFTDADCVPASDWLSAIAAAGRLPLIGTTREDDTTWIGRGLGALRTRYYARVEAPLEITPQNFGRIPKGTDNFACRKGSFLKASPSGGGQRLVADDTELFLALLREGPVLKSPAVRVLHTERPTAYRLARQWQHRGVTSTDFALRRRPWMRFLFLAGFAGGIVGFAWLLWLLFPWSLLVLALPAAVSLLLARSLREALPVLGVLAVIAPAYLAGMLRRSLLP